MPRAMNDLECTGERVIEDDYRRDASSYLIYLMHVATYEFSFEHVRGKKVLDFGCGSGYGTRMVADLCDHVTGVDIAPDAVAYAREKYRRDNLSFQTIEDIGMTPLPFPDESFDVVLSFQVVEHVRDVARYFAEIRRVLRPGGTVILATPDRRGRLFPGQRPWNIYHVVEYSPRSFRKVMADQFPDARLYDMSGTPGVIDIELRRARRLRALTLPVTFPFSPDLLRRVTLGTAKRVTRQLRELRGPRAGREVEETRSYGFGPDDVRIGESLGRSVNIVAVATKGGQ